MAPVIHQAFDPEAFREDGHRLVDQLADYLARAEAGDMPVLPPLAPEEAMARWAVRDGGGNLHEIVAGVLESSNHLHHPRYVGHQVSAPLPQAALCDLVAALLNNGMASYEMGPAATAMENAVIAWMGSQLDLGTNAGGVFTSGGSMGNLTALLAMRQARVGDAWARGTGPSLAVLATDQAHYSISRAVQIMGWGAEGVEPVQRDHRFRMRADCLGQSLRNAEARGRRVVGVVASAGSTATGAYDPLEPIADFCAAHDLWLHVDAAHGGCAALSSRHRHLVRGIGRVDSVVWDAHKMLLVPALVTGVLFRDQAHGYGAFSQEASYLFGQGRAWDIGVRTLECTKRMMSLMPYAALAVYGTTLFSEHVDITFERARRFAALLRSQGDFEVPVDPSCNIVCFRYAPPSGHTADELDALQGRVRARLVESGSFYLVDAWLDGRRHLRTAIMNPLTEDADLAQLVAAIRSVS